MGKQKLILMSFLFATIGVTTEVCFTAIYEQVKNSYLHKPISWALEGSSYIWMMPIYGSIPFFAQFLSPWLSNFSVFTQAFWIVLLIYIVEFTTGALLHYFTGACPWEYKEGIHFLGYVRIDYFPFWYVFAFFILYIYRLLDRKLLN